MPEIEIVIGEAELEFLEEWLNQLPEDKRGTIPVRIIRRIIEERVGYENSRSI